MKIEIIAEEKEMTNYIAQVLKELEDGCHSGYWSSKRHWDVVE